MPLYEYICESCGDQFEKMVRLSEQDLRPQCPTCQSDQTRKQLSLFASRSAGGSLSGASAASCSSGSSPFR